MPGQHGDLVPGRGHRLGQRVHVPAEPADHHRRVLPGQHQHAHPADAAIPVRTDASKPARSPGRVDPFPEFTRGPDRTGLGSLRVQRGARCGPRSARSRRDRGAPEMTDPTPNYPVPRRRRPARGRPRTRTRRTPVRRPPPSDEPQPAPEPSSTPAHQPRRRPARPTSRTPAVPATPGLATAARTASPPGPEAAGVLAAVDRRAAVLVPVRRDRDLLLGAGRPALEPRRRRRVAAGVPDRADARHHRDHRRRDRHRDPARRRLALNGRPPAAQPSRGSSPSGSSCASLRRNMSTGAQIAVTSPRRLRSRGCDHTCGSAVATS